MRRLLVLPLVTLAACATTRPLQAEYTDPNTIELLSDQFSPNDLQLIADRMARSLIAAPALKTLAAPPRVVVARLVNKTSESVDMDALADSIQIALFKQGGFEVVDPKSRQAIAREYEYQQSGYVNADQARGPGQQVAADYIVTGTLSAITERAGADAVVFYKMSMLASDLKSGTVRWAEDQQIRKRVVLTGISTDTSRRLKIGGYATAAGMFVAGGGLLIAGMVRGFGWTTYDCVDPPFNRCTRDNQPDAPMIATGGGLMIGAVVAAILTAVLVPEGNPRIRAGLLLDPRGSGGLLSLGGTF